MKGDGHVQIPLKLIGQVAPAALVVYAAIAAHDRGQGCWASWQTLAADTALSYDTVRRAAHDLRDRGVLSIERRQAPKGGTTSNLIRVVR